MKKCITHLVTITTVLSMQGCSGTPTGRITGKVSFNNKPVFTGTVRVVSEDGKSNSMGAIFEDGSYVVENAPVGKVKVTINIPRLTDGDPTDGKGPSLPPEIREMEKKFAEYYKNQEGKSPPKMGFNPEGTTIPHRLALKALEAVPARFANPNFSGLSTQVTMDQETILDIALPAR